MEITEIKRHLDGRVQQFPCQLIYRDEDAMVIRFNAAGTDYAPKIHHSEGYFWLGRTYLVYKLYDEHNQVLGHRLDVCKDVQFGPDWLEFTDLLLDYVVSPSGEVVVEDEDEVAAAIADGTLNPLDEDIIAQTHAFIEAVLPSILAEVERLRVRTPAPVAARPGTPTTAKLPANHYHFITPWFVDAPAERVWPIISDATTFPHWWGDVFLRVEQLSPDTGPPQIGRRLRYLTKGFLPYKLDWTAEVTRVDHQRLLEIRALGDFDGRASWTLQPRGEGTLLTLDWELRAELAFIRIFSPVLRRLFEFNHNWAMRKGEAGLRAYLAGSTADR